MIIPNTPQPRELGSLAKTMKNYEKSNDNKEGLSKMVLDKSNTPTSTGDPTPKDVTKISQVKSAAPHIYTKLVKDTTISNQNNTSDSGLLSPDENEKQQDASLVNLKTPISFEDSNQNPSAKEIGMINHEASDEFFH